MTELVLVIINYTLPNGKWGLKYRNLCQGFVAINQQT